MLEKKYESKGKFIDCITSLDICYFPEVNVILSPTA